ncbi:disks large-associated protein 5-like isoform X2 [Limulus polyphemus]|uniref:Disks large-associated protein 5-like isoform X2 n=1 Tax=Limulus polyphemus TaxID=6850 RepID=A0ABM1RV55_LIMPO|nr:disks large-associated protein 5-like isoform X2 [Limulus polyphemus]
MFSSDIDSRVLRAHRRTLDRKDIRHEQLSRRRNINSSNSTTSFEVEPLAEFHKPKKSDGPKNQSNSEPAGQETNKATNRREMLKKWKAERELKKKMEMHKHKPVFRVGHVDHDTPRYLVSSSSEVLKKENANTSKTWNLKTSAKNSSQSANLTQTKPSQQTTNLRTRTTGTSVKSTQPSHTKPISTTRKVVAAKQAETRAHFPLLSGPITRSKAGHLKTQKSEETRTRETGQSSSGKIGNKGPKKDCVIYQLGLLRCQRHHFQQTSAALRSHQKKLPLHLRNSALQLRTILLPSILIQLVLLWECHFFVHQRACSVTFQEEPRLLR